MAWCIAVRRRTSDLHAVRLRDAADDVVVRVRVLRHRVGAARQVEREPVNEGVVDGGEGEHLVPGEGAVEGQAEREEEDGVVVDGDDVDGHEQHGRDVACRGAHAGCVGGTRHAVRTR